MVLALLGNKNVDSDRLDKGGNTPLAWAVNNRHEGVANPLLGQKDVDPNGDENDSTQLGYAALNAHEGLVKVLQARIPDTG